MEMANAQSYNENIMFSNVRLISLQKCKYTFIYTRQAYYKVSSMNI